MSFNMNRAKQIWHAFNPTLLGACSVIAISQFNFGFDQTAFSTTQAMDAFVERFGKYDPETKAYEIEPYFLSLLNSLPYVGFALGTSLPSDQPILHADGR
jgi:MFS transporter, SP family, sugar:H+ symporter